MPGPSGIRHSSPISTAVDRRVGWFRSPPAWSPGGTRCARGGRVPPAILRTAKWRGPATGECAGRDGSAGLPQSGIAPGSPYQKAQGSIIHHRSGRRDRGGNPARRAAVAVTPGGDWRGVSFHSIVASQLPIRTFFQKPPRTMDISQSPRPEHLPGRLWTGMGAPHRTVLGTVENRKECRPFQFNPSPSHDSAYGAVMRSEESPRGSRAPVSRGPGQVHTNGRQLLCAPAAIIDVVPSK